MYRNRERFVTPEGRAPHRLMRTLAGGLAVALSAVALVGTTAVTASAEPATSSPVVSADHNNFTLALKAPKVTVTKVTAVSTPTSAGTSVKTTVSVKNNASVRKPVLYVRLYLTDGDTKLKLGSIRVKSLAAGKSATVRATNTASLKAPAGDYSVLACRGPYETQKCRASAATVTVEPAQLVSSAAVLALGEAAVGSTSATRTVTVKNRGHATTGTLTASVPASSGFSITTSTCGPSLNPGKSCKVSVSFAPTSAGAVLSSLAVSGTRVDPLSVALTGTGLGAALAISQDSYAFDDTVVGSASDPVELVVTNTGNIGTGIPDVALTSDDDFTVTASSCTQVLAPAATCTVAVAFTPTTPGEQSDTVTVSAAPGGSVSADLSGTGLAPASLSSDPEALVFGDELIGETTDTQTVTITNDGDVASGLPTVALDGEDADQFTVVDNDCTVALAAGASCDVELAFAPTASSVASALLAVTGAPGEAASAALGGVGQTAATLSISETSYDFGFSGSPAEHSFTVTNTGDAVSGDPSVNLAGSSAFDVTSDTCTAPLAGGASCTVGVVYTGSGSGEQSAELSVTANPGDTVTASLTGSPQALTVSPTSHDFGGFLVGESSDTKSFTLTNHRLTPVQVDGESVTGPFPLDASCFPVVLPAGGTCTFTVHFAPTSAGPASGSIDYSAQGGSATVELSGEGLSPAAFSLSPSSIDFGAYAPGDTGTQQVTVTNTGTQASSTIDTTITGTDAAEFDVDSTDCPAILAGGASCTVSVEFTPDTLGDKTATFTVAGAPGGTASLVALGAPEGVTLFPETHDYGAVAVGGASYFTFRVVNTTENGEDMNSASSGPPFPLELNQDFTCVLVISTIQPHRWCTMTLSFKPQSIGSFSTTLTAGGTNFNTQSQLSGIGVPAGSSARTSGKSTAKLPTSLQLRHGESVVGYE